MSNGIGRLRTMGIAAQPTFGTPVTVSQYVIPLTNAPQIDYIVNKLENTSALGSAYQVNEIENANRMAEVPLEFKVDEDQFPLFLKQRFDITSTTVSGETAVWSHALAYGDDTNTWYTLVMQDDQRNDYVVQDVLLTNLDVTFDSDFIRVSSTARGAYPVTATVSNTVTQPKEFVGRMTNFAIANDGATTATSSALTIESQLAFGTNGDDTMFALGENDISTHLLTGEDAFQFNVTQLKSDNSNQDDFRDNTAKQFVVTAQSTDRFVTGSVASTRPEIEINVPYAKINEYSEEADIDQLIQETIGYKALDKVGESGAPMALRIVNAIPSY